MDKMRRIFASAIALLIVQSVFAPAAEARSAGFAFGRGGTAARVASTLQHMLRERIRQIPAKRLVDVLGVVQPEGEPRKLASLARARELFERAKKNYEQLELESAVADLENSLKAYEHGYGWLANPAELIDPLIYLGAISVLVGEPEKAEAYFTRAMNMPGKAVLSADVFPPNIQEVFERVRSKYEESKKYSVKLISEPLGAEVFIDGRFAGTTPVLAEGLAPGEHMVMASRDGYLPWGGTIRVSKKRTRILKLKLRPAQKRAEFSTRLRKLVRELMKGKPGEAAAEMGRFLGAEELYLFWLSGPASAMTIKGWRVTELGGKPTVVGTDEVLDAKSPSLEKSLDEIITRVLSLGAPEPVAEAEAGEGFGLDLSVEEGAEQKKEEPEAVAEGGEATGITAEGVGSAKPEKAITKEVVEKTRPVAAPAGHKPSWWAGLHRKWWFWTAVGVVVAGAAVGGYFGATAGSSGGGLVISLH